MVFFRFGLDVLLHVSWLSPLRLSYPNLTRNRSANVLAIVSSIMSECGSSGSETVYNLSVAIDWFTCLSWVFFLGTVLIPFCGYLYKVNGGNAASKVVKIVNFIVIGSFTVYTIATLAISTYIRSDSFDTDVDSWNAYRLINATNRLFAVFYTLLFLACCWAAALMFIPLFRMRSHGIVSGGLKFKIPAFAFIFALKSLLWCVYRWYYIISTGDITFSSRTGWFAVFTILEIIVYIQLINILSSPALSATKGNYNPMTAQAKGVGEPSYAQPAPQPYTAYDGAAGHHTQPHQPQPMYGAGPNSAQQWSTYAVQPGQQPAVQYAPNPHYR